MKTTKKLLLASTALIAALTFAAPQSAHAAAVAIADNTDVDIDTDNVTTTVDGKYLNIDLVNTNDTVNGADPGLNIDHTSTIYIYDADADATANTLTLSSSGATAIDVADTETLTIVIGQKNDASATTNDVIVSVVKAVTNNTSGIINISTATNAAGQVLNFTGAATSVDLGTGTITLNNTADTLRFGTDAADVAVVAGTITGNIAAGADGKGAVIFEGSHAGAGAATFTGNIGGAATHVSTLTFDNDSDGGDDAFTVTGNVFANTLALTENDGGGGSGTTLTIDSTGTVGANIGAITTELDADSNLTLKTSSATGSTFTVTGAMGGSAVTALRNIVLDDQAAGKVVTLVLSGTSEHFFTDLSAGTAGEATLSATGDVTIGEGTIGAAAAIGTLNVAAAKTFDYGSASDIGVAGVVKANDIALGAAATLTISNSNAGGNTITGDINGNGTFQVNENATVVGNVGDTNDLTAVNVAAGKTLTIDAATLAADATLAATKIEMTGAASTLALASGANTITVANDVSAFVDGAGVVTIADGAGVIDFMGDVGVSTAKSLASLTAANGAGVLTINANGDIFVDAVTLNTDDTLNLLATTGTVSGTVVGGAAGRGFIVIGDGASASAYTFSSAIGGTTIGGFKVDTGATATVQGTTVATTATGAAVVGVDINGTLNMDTTNNVVAVSTAVGDTDIDGTVSITGANSATLSAGSDLFIDGTLTMEVLANNKTLALTGATKVGLTSNTTLNLGNQAVTTGAVTLGAAGRTTTLNFMKTANFDPAATTVVDATGDIVTVENTTGILNIGIADGSLGFADGDTIDVIDGAGTNATTSYAVQLGSGRIVLVDTGLVDLQDNASDLDTLSVKVVLLDAGDVLADNASGAANALTGFGAAAGVMATVRGDLISALTAADAQDVAETISPTVDGGEVAAAFSVAGQSMSIVGDRLADARIGTDVSSGVAAGNMGSGNRMWGQVFGQASDQSDRDGVDGYNANTYGVAVGVDTENATDGVLVGLALSYGMTDVSSDNAATTDTDVNSYQVTAYGTYDVAPATFINGMVGYARNTIDSTRHNVGGPGINANADYSANQFMAKVEGGRDLDYKGTRVTPSVLANWMHYDPNGYTETGAGAFNMTVAGDTLSSFGLGVGLEIAGDVRGEAGARTEPSVRFGYIHDFTNDKVATTSSWAGGGAAFRTEGADPADDTFDVGVGIKHITSSEWELSAGYDFEFKQDFSAHAGQVRAGYKF